MQIPSKTRRITASAIDVSISFIIILAIIFPEQWIERLISGPHIPEYSPGLENTIIIQNRLGMIGFVLFVIAVGAFYVFSESSTMMGTPGKRLCGMAVTDLPGNRITRRRAAIRFIVRLVLLFLLVLFTMMAVGSLVAGAGGGFESSQEAWGELTGFLFGAIGAIVISACLLVPVNRKGQRTYDWATRTILIRRYGEAGSFFSDHKNSVSGVLFWIVDAIVSRIVFSLGRVWGTCDFLLGRRQSHPTESANPQVTYKPVVPASVASRSPAQPVRKSESSNTETKSRGEGIGLAIIVGIVAFLILRIVCLEETSGFFGQPEFSENWPVIIIGTGIAAFIAYHIGNNSKSTDKQSDTRVGPQAKTPSASLRSQGHMQSDKRITPILTGASSKIEKLLAAAKNGDAIAQFDLGWFLSSEGESQDLNQAAYWFQKAAEQGMAEAQNNFGCMMQKGIGVPQNPEAGIQWIMAAAQRGYALAQKNLGESYWTGWGVPIDLNMAKYWLNKAADQGNEQARELLLKHSKILS